MSLADGIIVSVLIIIFVCVIRFFIKEHRRGVPLECVSCPFLSDQQYNHSNCDHHQHFNPALLDQIKKEVHLELENKYPLA